MTRRRNPPTVTGLERPAAGQLIEAEGAQVGRAFDLADSMLIGRAPDAAIQINDARASRRHARVVRSPRGTHVIEDLGSANGTRVNGVPIQRHELKLGDHIRIGERTLLVFVQRDPVEDEMLQRRRLEALGRMGVGVSHDLNNMLAAIGSTLDFLDGLPAETPMGAAQIQECLHDLRMAGTQATELTSMLLGFVKGEGPKQTHVDIGLLWSRIVRLLGHVLDRSITIEHAPVAPGLVVRGRQAELLQVFLNLCLNARDAMPQGGTLGIHVERSETAQVVIRVSDTGAGMDEKTRRRVFEPFFSTKRSRRSFGLGLAIASDVVKRHGGQIDVRSTPGQGSVFTVGLPLRSEKTPTAPLYTSRPPASAVALDGSGVLLLVDDEEIVRRSLRRLLQKAGYEVREAANGKEALAQYFHAGPKPDLVLLDLDMPEMGGLEAWHQLREQDEYANVVFMSGHRDRLLEEAPVGARSLAKPCDAHELLTEVHMAILSGPPLEEETNRVSLSSIENRVRNAEEAGS